MFLKKLRAEIMELVRVVAANDNLLRAQLLELKRRIIALEGRSIPAQVQAQLEYSCACGAVNVERVYLDERNEVRRPCMKCGASIRLRVIS